MAQFALLSDLAREIDAMGSLTAEYWDKQIHPVPASKTVDRVEYLQGLASKKTILHVGCTGHLDTALQAVATKVYGLDATQLDRPDYVQIDLDHLSTLELPLFEGVELVVCGEVLEHLSNPGRFLLALQNTYPTQPVVFTVPNAFCLAGQEWLVKRGRENVNRDHVCYYSYTTLNTLLWRAHYDVKSHYWYGGRPYVSEGLIMLATPAKD